MSMPTIPRILATTVLCLAAVGLSSCSNEKPAPVKSIHALVKSSCKEPGAEVARKEMMEHYESYLAGTESLRDFPYIATVALISGLEKREDSEILPILIELAAAGADVLAAEESAGLNAMHGAALAGASNTMIWLEQQGVSRESRDNLGRTPSMMAAMGGQLETLKTLTSTPAALMVEDNMGQRLHFYAAQGGSLPCLKYLEEQGLDIIAPATKNNAGQPIIVAAYSGSIPCVEFLLAKGADLYATFGDGVNAFHYAAWGGQSEMLSYLLSKGFDIHTLDKNGCNALHHAAFGGHVPVMKTLCEAGIDINHRANSSMTPLFIAAMQGHFAAVEFLLSHGADKTVRDATGQTAADYARMRGHADIYHLLTQQ